MDDLETAAPSETERSYLRKLLARLVPFLAILYVFCLLDRGNLSIAALTMQSALRFSDTVYGVGAGMFFLGYFFFEVPSNLILERVGARRWIARIMLTWGAISGAMLFVHNPISFYVLRFMLGVAEAGFYPGILLYMTYWVPANARARVIARFLALSAVLGLFGGPLGGLLLRLNGLHGLAGWQWLFLLEGMPSILLSVVVLRFLPDRPEQAGWLTPLEKSWLAGRLALDARREQRVEHFNWRTALADPRVMFLCLNFFVTATAGNAVGFFGPTDQEPQRRIMVGLFRGDHRYRPGAGGSDRDGAGSAAFGPHRPAADACRAGLRYRRGGLPDVCQRTDGVDGDPCSVGECAGRAHRRGLLLGADHEPDGSARGGRRSGVHKLGRQPRRLLRPDPDGGAEAPQRRRLRARAFHGGRTDAGGVAAGVGHVPAAGAKARAGVTSSTTATARPRSRKKQRLTETVIACEGE
jgi:MFS family permease